MTYYNHGKSLRKEQCATKFEELKKTLISKDENGMLNEFYMAYEHIIELENKIKKQDSLIDEYKQFFTLLKKLLPKELNTFK